MQYEKRHKAKKYTWRPAYICSVLLLSLCVQNFQLNDTITVSFRFVSTTTETTTTKKKCHYKTERNRKEIKGANEMTITTVIFAMPYWTSDNEWMNNLRRISLIKLSYILHICIYVFMCTCEWVCVSVCQQLTLN